MSGSESNIQPLSPASLRFEVSWGLGLAVEESAEDADAEEDPRVVEEDLVLDNSPPFVATFLLSTPIREARRRLPPHAVDYVHVGAIQRGV